MNILITLPKELISKIISGEKIFEMRKCQPKRLQVGEDGFFVVEKGTDKVHCWCRVDVCRETYMGYYSAGYFSRLLCVTDEYIQKYANGKKVYLWGIGKVVVCEQLKRDELYIDKNPQQFEYCPCPLDYLDKIYKR